MIFYRSQEGEDILFELQADEFFGTHVAHGTRTRGVRFVPGVGDGLRQEVDPAAVGGGESERGAKGSRRYGDCCLIELEEDQFGYLEKTGAGTYVDQDVAVAIFLL